MSHSTNRVRCDSHCKKYGFVLVWLPNLGKAEERYVGQWNYCTRGTVHKFREIYSIFTIQERHIQPYKYLRYAISKMKGTYVTRIVLTIRLITKWRVEYQMIVKGTKSSKQKNRPIGRTTRYQLTGSTAPNASMVAASLTTQRYSLPNRFLFLPFYFTWLLLSSTPSFSAKMNIVLIFSQKWSPPPYLHSNQSSICAWSPSKLL